MDDCSVGDEGVTFENCTLEEEIRLMLDTMNANSFNFIMVNNGAENQNAGLSKRQFGFFYAEFLEPLSH